MKAISLKILFCILLFSNLLQAAEIRFQAPEWAGSYFKFYIIPNFISNKKVTLYENIVGDKGEFKFSFDLKTTTTVYIEFGAYQGWFVGEPGKSYTLAIPPFKAKNSNNPYFKPEIVNMGIIDTPDDKLNPLIAEFNSKYIPISNKYSFLLQKNRSKEMADSLIAMLKTQFPATTFSYFEEYKNYKYALLSFHPQPQNPKVVIEDFFNNKPILYSNSEYSFLFYRLFKNYLMYAAQAIDGGERIRQMIGNGYCPELIEWLVTEKKFDPQLSEAIILYGIDVLFRSKKFPANGILNILQYIKEKSKYPVHKELASKIYDEFANFLFGTLAPELALNDSEGNLVVWNNFRGKYVYLCFTESNNSSFISHQKNLQELKSKYNIDLELVIVLEDANFDLAKEKLNKTSIKWTLLNGKSNEELIDLYQVKIYPSYFLIDSNGKNMGSASWPDEDFDQQLSFIIDEAKKKNAGN